MKRIKRILNIMFSRDAMFIYAIVANILYLYFGYILIFNDDVDAIIKVLATIGALGMLLIIDFLIIILLMFDE
jgi:ammonia channel protein AmtB